MWRRRLPSTFALVLLIETLLGAGIAVIAVRAHDDTSASGLLRRARAFVDGARSVRFEGTTSAGGNFSEPGTLVRARGVARLPDRFRVVHTHAGRLDEVEIVGIGDERFARERLSGGEPLDGAWYRDEPEEAPGGRVGPPEEFGGDDVIPPDDAAQVERIVDHVVFLSPTGLSEVLAAAHRPVVRDRERGRTLVRAEIVGPMLFGRASPPLDTARLEILVDGDGRVDEVTVAVSVRPLGLRASARYELRDWDDDDIEVAAPPEDEVARDEVIDKEAVGLFGRDLPLYAPRAIPQGWILRAALVLEPDETVEGCAQLQLDYEDPFDEEAGYLSIFEFLLDCSQGPDEGARVFRAGPYAGFVEDGEESRFGEVYVSGTVVQFVSDLSSTDLATVLGDLVPLDLEQTPGSLPGVGGGVDVL